MKYIIFTTVTEGHNIEYIHHVYQKFQYMPEHELYICVPDSFEERKNLLVWACCPNIKFSYFKTFPTETSHSLKESWKAAHILKQKCIEIKPDHVILVTLMSVMPFILWIIPKGITLSGIIYNIYLYLWHEDSSLKRMEDLVKYFLISKSRRITKAFILNDSISAMILNKKWRTRKFCYLPDPFLPMDKTSLKNVRKEYGISDDKLVFLHFGSINKRKGAIEILESIERMTNEQSQNCCFIFAGVIRDEIRELFYQKYHSLKEKTQILVFDQFCSYEFIGNLCKSSDYLLLPYKNTSFSSGVIAYGIQFGIPVIVRDKGLVPKLVRRYHMGILIKGDFVASFIEKLPLLAKKNMEVSKKYLCNHTVEQFQDVLIGRNN